MTVTFGFYNSIDGDRRYDAIQMASIFDGVIKDGVFASVGTAMIVQPSSGMSIVVGEGRAWFNHTWTLNDTPLVLILADSSLLLPRIDAVVLEVDSNVAVRTNTIKILTGEPLSTPQRPTWTNTTLKHTYPLAYIAVPIGITTITSAQITNMVGTSACPFVLSPVTGVNVDTLLSQWNAQFGVWFLEMKDQLSVDAAGNLQNEIDALVVVDTSLQTQINNFSNNISDGAVHQNHLAAGASKIVARQGSDPTNWNEADAIINNYMPLANASIQVGNQYVHGAGAGEFIVTFPIPFAGKPIVVLTPDYSPVSPDWLSARVVSTSTTGFVGSITRHKATSPYNENATALCSANWIAIGPLS